jgi:tyrosine-protein kinase Etk/Wzc
LRRGRLSLYAQLSEKALGLSDLLLGQANLAECIHTTSVENLNLMPIGSSRVFNSADLLMSKAFESLLEDLASRFQHVLIDTPPVLALTDASIIGRRCGTTLLVLEAGQSSLREVVETCRRLEQTGTKVSGIVFNKVSMKGNAYGYGPALNAYYDHS